MKEDFNYKKSLGQNFLQDKNIVHKIVDSAGVDKDTLVIEIGPGDGALSCLTIPLCKRAILYEIDDRLSDRLNNLLGEYDNYSLVIGDFLKADLVNDIGEYSKLYVVANLPYYITTPIIMKFINDKIFPDKFVIMVQKEVALRFAASVGSKSYGALTVLLNYFYDIDKLFDVSRYSFKPVPNVDSAVVCMNFKKNRLSVNDFDFFKKIVMDSFRMKRKTLRNNLKGYDLEKIEEVLNKYNFDLNVRAEQLTLEIFVDIANCLEE